MKEQDKPLSKNELIQWGVEYIVKHNNARLFLGGKNGSEIEIKARPKRIQEYKGGVLITPLE